MEQETKSGMQSKVTVKAHIEEVLYPIPDEVGVLPESTFNFYMSHS